MIAKMIEGVTRVLGKSQGYLSLPIRDEAINEQKNKEGAYVWENAMVSAWEPSPDELVKLNEGGHIYIRILGTNHPPIGVGVQ